MNHPRFSASSGPRWPGWLRTVTVLAAVFLGLLGSAQAQLSGTYTVGGSSANYASIEDAVSALVANGVSGAVVFSINDGTYAPPSDGYLLPPLSSMSATNTVTFRPASGASVVIDGGAEMGVFRIVGSHYILDGTNTADGSSRDWQIINQNTDYPAIGFFDGAQYNTIRNMVLMSGSYDYTRATVSLGPDGGGVGGTSYNTIINNTIGDPSGSMRSVCGVWCGGINASGMANIGNTIEGNDIINSGMEGNPAFGIYISPGTRQTKIRNNRISNPEKGSFDSDGFGIVFDNVEDSDRDSISGNRIWDVGGINQDGSQYGMVIYHSNSSSLTVHDNMISLFTDGNGYIIGIQVGSSGGNAYLYHNSINIASSVTGEGSSNNLLLFDAPTITLENNILVNQRSSRARASNGLIFLDGNVTLTSNYNLLYADGAGTMYGYDGSSNRTSLADWQSNGMDANSVTTSPRFLDPSTGNLHISTTLRTPVEGRGTPISGLTADIDGDERNSTTPDIGADEGDFLGLLENDLEMIAMERPIDGGYLRSSTMFDPSVKVLNIGTTAQSPATVRFQIVDPSSGLVVYDDAQSTSALAPFESETITFAQTGSINGSTNLSPGDYEIRTWTDLANDDDRNNDSIIGRVTVKAPLNGTYTIDQNGSGDRNYPSFTAAATELNQVGVAGPVRFEIADGTYGERSGETLPIKIGTVDGVGSSATVTFVPASGALPVVEGSPSKPIFDLDGADWVHFDGSNSGNATDRSWTIINGSPAPAIQLANGAQHNVIENMYLIGGLYAPIIYISEDPDGNGGNSYNTIASNTLGDSTGSIRADYGVYMYGTVGSANTDNRIEKNEIINFGTDFDTGFGVYVENGNAQTKIIGNAIHNPMKDGGSGGAQGILFASYESSELDTIAYNHIWDMSTTRETAALYGIQLGGQAEGSSMVIHDNMISIVANRGTNYGMMIRPGTGNAYIYNNSVYMGGDYSGSTQSFAIRVYYGGTTTLVNNILANMRTSTGSNTNRVLYRNSTDVSLRSDNNVLYANGSSTVLGYDGSGYSSDLATWQAATGMDANSKRVQPPFVDAGRGDLHLLTEPLFTGESAGTPIAGENDFDGDTRDARRPDIGADEGNFNGGGITVLYPNGGENLISGYETSARFRINRPMSVTIEISTDNGSTWAPAGAADLAGEGDQEVTITTPDVLTSNGRIRVISVRNNYEADTSDNPFNLVSPIVTMVSPNGGERWVAGDTFAISWNTEYLPGTLTATLELSTDNGSSWTEVASGLHSQNLPGTNSHRWIVPNTPTDQAMVRIVVPGITATDRSNATFTIIEQPSVTLVTPVTGTRWYAGDKDTIRWTSTTTDNVTLEYSLDGGSTWTEIAHRIPAYLGNFPWTLPNTTTTNAIVRLTSTERPRYFAESGRFSILKSQLHLTSPNGGEGYELNAPVAVSWTASDVDRVRIEFSADNGITWTVVASGIDAAAGSASFTPPQVPTKVARVRVVDENRLSSRDASDAVFEILQPKSITLFSPAAGDGFGRNSTTVIYWRSVRLSTLNIYYSSNGGDSWQLVASNVSAPAGTYTWNVPNQNTEDGKIRLTEVGGDIVVESGRFTIVDPATPVLRVLSPNGGESYSIGEMATILWNASGITTPLTVSYSSDGGSTWNTITTSAQPGAGQYQWLLGSVTPGTSYRVRVSAPTVSDASDANFTVKAQLSPKLTLTAPNGGETYMVGSSRTITWNAQDVFGNFAVSYSTDDGNSWTDITLVPANASGNGTYSTNWTVPNTPSIVARVRVMASTATDISDGSFEIKAREIVPIVVTAPNGGESWPSGDSRRITWTAPSDVANVKIDYSLDGGTSWTTVIGTTPNDGSHDWTVPNVTVPTSEAVVRVYDVTDGLRMDMSDAPFTISPKVITPIRVLTPNGGEVLAANTPYQVTFTAPADVPSVWIYFSRDGGTNWEPVAGPVPATTGSYNWQVPATTTQITTAMIRVVDAADASRKDESDAVFTINAVTAGVDVDHGTTGGSGISLSGNFPNPFAGSTEIRWTQQTPGETSLLLFRGNGVVVRNLPLGSLDAGRHSYDLEANDLPSGAYYYELRSGSAFARGMMLITR